MNEVFREPKRPVSQPDEAQDRAVLERRSFLKQIATGAAVAGLVGYATVKEGPDRIPNHEAVPKNELNSPIDFLFTEGFIKKLERKEQSAIRLLKVFTNHYANREIELRAFYNNLVIVRDELPGSTSSERNGIQVSIDKIHEELRIVSESSAALKRIDSYMGIHGD